MLCGGVSATRASRRSSWSAILWGGLTLSILATVNSDIYVQDSGGEALVSLRLASYVTLPGNGSQNVSWEIGLW